MTRTLLALVALVAFCPAAAPAAPTLAKHLSQQGYRPLTPPRDVDGPGAVVEFRDGREVVVASSEPPDPICSSLQQLRRTADAALPTDYLVKKAGAFELDLARVLSGVDVGAAFQDRRVRGVRVVLTEPFEESLAADALETELGALAFEDACLETLTDAGRFLIRKALGASGVTYRFTGRGGAEVPLDEDLLAAIGLDGPRSGVRLEASALVIGFPIFFAAQYSAVEPGLGFGESSIKVRAAAALPPTTRRSLPHDAAIPTFPWPPPRASTTEVLPPELLRDSDGDERTLADLDRRLVAALDSAGYFEKAYYAVPSGFAVVTRLEQMRDDGASEEVPQRWSTEMPRLREFSLRAYLRALFIAPKGRYRTIVFVVTPVPFSQELTPVEAGDAELWLTEGLNRLPGSIGQEAVAEETSVTALIYEFVWADHEERPGLVGASSLPARSHLERAKIWQALEP